MTKKSRFRFCCTAIAAVLLFYTSCAPSRSLPGETYGYGEASQARLQTESQTPAVPLLTVFVCGAVQREGVYELPEGSRLIDAVTLAGGFAPGAAERFENLARPLSDGEKIVIPFLEDVTENPYGGAKPDDGLVNINTAGAEELMTLPGIGSARAAAILDYRRENGAFTAVEDLMKVSGIKQASFDRLKNYVTVGP